jgi:hypothetical protein
VQRLAIRLGVDGDGLYTELAARADHAKSNLTAVRDQDLLKQNLDLQRWLNCN